MVVETGKVEVGGVFEEGEEVGAGEGEVGEAAVEEVEGHHCLRFLLNGMLRRVM